MILKIQRKIEFNTCCDAIYNKVELAEAILWFSSRPVCRMKCVFKHGEYPAVSIYDKKIHIHRLLMMYWMNRDLAEYECVHHKNGNKMDSSKENLEIMLSSEHQSKHNKGKTLTVEHRKKIGEANKKRRGMKRKKTIKMPDLQSLLEKGWSINKIAEHYGCDWSIVRNRIHDNPELLKK